MAAQHQMRLPDPAGIAEEAVVPRQKKRAAAPLAVNIRHVAPDLFRMLITRYQPAARAVPDTSRRGWLSSLTGRFERSATSEIA